MSIFSQLRRWRYWRGVVSVIGSILVFVGLFGTWLWHPMPQYRDTILEISPLCVRLIEHGVLRSWFWFYELSLGLSLSAMGLIVAAVLCLISFGRWKVSLAGCFFYVISIMLFFLSFGRGLSIGVKTLIGWGLWVTIVGGIVMFASATINWLWCPDEKT